MTRDKILSIQSHVVHGYVGNRAATFPLQIRGWDVDVLNTVQFSNHPAYGQFKGQKYSPETLKEIYSGLFDIGVEYDAVLTGYIPGGDGLQAINDICQSLCSQGIKWVLDPVLGDHGRIYVSEGNIALYKTILKSGQVYCVTPNQLELEVLSGVEVTDLKSLKDAIISFSKLYPVEHTVVTSVEFEDDRGHLYSAGCTNDTIFYFKVPKINASFSGSGDLFSAILTSSLFKYNADLSKALNEALSVVAKVLELTYQYEEEANGPLSNDVKINDLKLIQAKKYYEVDLCDFVSVEL